jgi:hypothetical protein
VSSGTLPIPAEQRSVARDNPSDIHAPFAPPGSELQLIICSVSSSFRGPGLSRIEAFGQSGAVNRCAFVKEAPARESRNEKADAADGGSRHPAKASGAHGAGRLRLSRRARVWSWSSWRRGINAGVLSAR